MEISFERASAGDALNIQNLYRQLVNDPNIHVDAEQILKIQNDPYNFLLVAKIKGKLVGTAFLTLCQDVMYKDQPFGVLENVIVDQAHQRLGIGCALMDYIKGLCKEHRCSKIMLLSSDKRKEAHLFFEKCGYVGNLKRAFVNYINRS